MTPRLRTGLLTLLAATVFPAAAMAQTVAPAATAQVPPACRVLEPSRFWSSLQAACRDPRLGALAPSGMVTREVLDDTRAFCATARKAPAFAAKAESERLALTNALVTQIGSRLSDPPEALTEVSTDLLKYAAQRFVPNERLHMGAAMGLVLSEGVGVICGSPDAQSYLPTTCSPLPTQEPLVALRDRLIADLAKLPARAWQDHGSVPPEVTQAFALLTSLQTQIDPAELLATVIPEQLITEAEQRCAAEYAEADAKVRKVTDELARANAALQQAIAQAQDAAEQVQDAAEQAKAKAEQLQAEVRKLEQELERLRQMPALFASIARQNDPLSIAAEVARRLLVDGAPQNLDTAYYVARAQAVLNELAPGTKLSNAQQMALKGLVETTGSLKTHLTLLKSAPDDRAALEGGLRSSFEWVNAMLAFAEKPSLPPDAVELAVALAQGNVENATKLAIAAAMQSSARISSDVDVAAQRAIELLRADGDDARNALILSWLVGAPWTKQLLLDANVSAFAVGGADLKLGGDGTLGYNGGDIGAVGTYTGSYYDLGGELLNETEQHRGTLEGWLTTDTARSLRFEGRFAAELSYQDTATTPDNRSFFQETSWLGRGSLYAAIRHQGSHHAVGLWLGGGVQYEYYDPLVATFDNSFTTTLTDDQSIGARGSARVRGEYHIFPSYLATRLRVNADAYNITRAVEQQTVSGATGSTTDDLQEETSRQLEVTARLYLDAEVARVMDFVPGISAGFDYFYNDNSVASASTLVPVFGAGIRRDTF